MVNTLMNTLASPDFISNVISSLMGTIIGAYLAYKIALKQFQIQKDAEIQEKQTQTALAYYEELTSSEFSFARTEASHIFGEHFSARNMDDFYSDLPEEKRKYILMVITYFRRLQLAIEYKQIDRQMVLDLFSREFFWWHFMWLDAMIPENWETRTNIDRLYQWFYSTLPREKFEELQKKGIERREKRLLDLASKHQAKG